MFHGIRVGYATHQPIAAVCLNPESGPAFAMIGVRCVGEMCCSDMLAFNSIVNGEIA